MVVRAFKLETTESEGLEEVTDNKQRLNVTETNVQVTIQPGTKVVGKVCGLPLSRTIDTGSKLTVITSFLFFFKKITNQHFSNMYT